MKILRYFSVKFMYISLLKIYCAMKKRYLLLFLTTLFLNVLHSQNLLSNGDFESGGNGVGFSLNGSGYNLITQPFSGISNPGDYAFTTNPQPINTGFFISSSDHTSGTGKMMVIDGNTTGGAQRFWRAGSTGGGVCGLAIGTTYTFTYWIKSVSTSVINPATQASIGIQFNNVSTSALVAGSTMAPLPAAGWQKVSYTFVPSNACVNIEIWNTNTGAVGNDFAVDDFSVTGPLSITSSVVNPSCSSTNDGSIVIYGLGGILPYASYSISGASSQTNTTGVFTGLAAGTYSIFVTDSAGSTIGQTNIIITAPTNPLIVSPNTTICSEVVQL